MSDLYKTVYGFSITRAERRWLHDMAEDTVNQFPKAIIVNIGVACGATMHCLRAGAPTAQLFGVDIDYKSNPIRHEEKLKATLIQGDSSVCHVDFHPAIHLIFIDGDHYYSAVKADIAGWAHKVVLRGVIAFHDYSPAAADLRNTPWLEGVRRAADEWIALEGAHWERLQTPGSICAFRRID